MRRSLPLLVLALAGVLAACGHGDAGHPDDHGAAASGGEATQPMTGIVLDPAPMVDAVTLPNVADDGRTFRFRASDGGLLLVFFGFTHCPDVCPTTLADVRTVLRRLPAEQRDRVTVAMVTVDPARDTAAVLVPYVHGFVPTAAALRTDDQTVLQGVAKAFGAAYEVAPDGKDVVHTTFLYAVDDAGSIVIQWPYGVPVDTLEADLSRLLADA